MKCRRTRSQNIRLIGKETLPAGTGQQSIDLDRYQGTMKPDNAEEPRGNLNLENAWAESRI
jgi:hypothetical protein